MERLNFLFSTAPGVNPLQKCKHRSARFISHDVRNDSVPAFAARQFGEMAHASRTFHSACDWSSGAIRNVGDWRFINGCGLRSTKPLAPRPPIPPATRTTELTPADPRLGPQRPVISARTSRPTANM